MPRFWGVSIFITLLLGAGGTPGRAQSGMPPLPGNPVRLRFPGRVEGREKPRAETDRPHRLLVVLVDFRDRPHQYPKESFDTLLFWPGAAGPQAQKGANRRSVRDYYQEVSYGRVTIEGDVVDWVQLDNPYSYYLGDSFGIYGEFPHNSQGLVRDVVRALDGRVDFSRYDGDGDRMVDGLVLVHSGPGAEETGNAGDIWSHKWQMSDPTFGSPGPVETGDGVRVDVFSVQPERFSTGELVTIGVFCHEFGHILGLPDLYDTDYSSAGLGNFCLMAAGAWARDSAAPPGSAPVHPCIWCKYLLGWMIPDSVEPGVRDSVFARLTASAARPSGYRILPNPGGPDWDGAGGGTGEYFLVENRQRFGFDRGLPGSGLLILHIDESRPNNDDDRYPLVGILRADRSPRPVLDLADRGGDAHLWKQSDTGVANFTTPSTAFYDGVPSGVVIQKISASGEEMSAVLKIAPLFLGRVYSFPNPVIPARGDTQATIVYTPTDSVRLAGSYPHFSVAIYNIAGEPVAILDREPEEINRTHRAAYWRLRNRWGRPVPSGMYFYIVKIEDAGIKEENVGRLTVIR